MTSTNLLLIIFFDERKEEGPAMLRKLLSAADNAEMTFFVHGRTEGSSADAALARISSTFNFVEGTLTIHARSADEAKLNVRYRPSILSKAWAQLDLPSDPAALMDSASRVHSRKEGEDFQLLLSLTSFDSASRKHRTGTSAVFEALHHSVPQQKTIEKTILRSFKDAYPEMLKRKIWGYADAVPWRPLSITEEWEAAKGAIFWSDLAISKDAWHQYLFVSKGAQPKVRYRAVAFTREI
jgi:hypothetical protein